ARLLKKMRWHGLWCTIAEKVGDASRSKAKSKQVADRRSLDEHQTRTNSWSAQAWAVHDVGTCRGRPSSVLTGSAMGHPLDRGCGIRPHHIPALHRTSAG